MTGPDPRDVPPGNAAWSARSLDAASRLPGRLVESSDTLGWRTLLARIYEEPTSADEFTTVPTPDFLVVLQLRGSYRIESRRGSEWVGAQYRAGSMGMTVPHSTATLRWRATGSTSPLTLQMHLSADLLDSTSESLGLGPAVDALPNDLEVNDHVGRDIGRAIAAGLQHRADSLCADSLALALATRVLSLGPQPRDVRPRTRTTGLGEQELRRVVEYMSDHMAGPVTLEDLAALLSISKYHFSRRFTSTTGETPYRFLTRLRVERAAHLLATTSSSVSEIAAAVGHRNAGRFGVLFRRQLGCSPHAYRHGS